MSVYSKDQMTPLNTLIVSQQLADAELIVGELRKAGYNPVWQRVETLEDFKQHLNPELDIILAEFSLPQIPGAKALDALSHSGLGIPVIIVTGAIEETAIKCLRRGAVDYLLSDRLTRLGPAVKTALEQRRIQEDNIISLEALRASEQLYRGVAETALTGLSITDPEERITYANSALARMLGYAPDDLLGMPLNKIIDPEDFPRIITETSKRKRGLSTQYEVTMLNKDGGNRNVIISASPITSKDGEYKGSQAVITDITELKQSEEKLQKSLERNQYSQRILLSLSQAGETIQHSGPINDIYESIGNKIKELGFDAALLLASEDLSALQIEYITYDQEKLGKLEQLTGFTRESFRIQLPLGGDYPEIFSKNDTQYFDSIDDLTTLIIPKMIQPLAKKVAATLGLGSIIHAPLVREGMPMGALFVTGIGLGEEHIPAVSTFANQVANALVNNKLLRDIQKSEDKFRSIFSGVQDAILVESTDGEILDANTAACEMYGWSRDDLIGKMASDLVPAGHRLVLFNSEINGGLPSIPIETINTRANGEQFPVELTARLQDMGDETVMLVVLRDVTERKLAEDKIQHLNIILRTIRNINELIVEEKDRDALIQKTCEILIDNRGYHNAWIVLLDDKNEYLISAEAGLGEKFTPMKKMLESGFQPVCTAKTLINKSKVVIVDPAVDCSDCPLARDYSGRKGLSIRLGYGNTVYGLLTVSIPEYISGSLEEYALFEEIGGDISFALHNIKIANDVKKAQDALVEANTIINRSPAVAFLWKNETGWPVEYVSENVTHLFGFTAQEFLEGKITYSQIVHEDDLNRVREEVESCSQSPDQLKILHNPYRIISNNNSIKWVEDATYIRRDSQGNITHYEGILYDVTERVKADLEIRQRSEDLALINRINTSVNLGKDFSVILKLFVEETIRIYNHKSTTVYLYDESQKCLEMHNFTYPPALVKGIKKIIGIDIPKIRIPVVDGSLTQEFLFAEGPRLINDPLLIQKWMLEFTHTVDMPEKSRGRIQKMISLIFNLIKVQSLIIVPMLSAGKVIGLVDFSSESLFSEEQKLRVAGVVGQVTAAITSLQAEKDTARSRELLLSLSQAAPVVQQANTADEIYRAIGEQVVKMGFDVTVFTLQDNNKKLAVTYHNLTDLARKIEKMTGLSSVNYSFQVEPGGYFHKIITDQKAKFSHFEIDPISETLPKLLRPLAAKIMDLFGNQQSIIAPLAVGGEVHGLLSISGSELTVSDIPAVTTFANHAAIALEKTSLFHETEALGAFNESIVQNMAEGIVLEDRDGMITYVNPAALTMLSYSSEDWVGKHWTSIVPPDQHALILKADEQRISGESDQYELELVNKDGHRISVLVSGSPRFDREGQFIGTMAVFTDISERKMAEREIQGHIKRQDALRVIDQAIISSFELNFSLNIILEQMLTQLDVDATAVLSYQADLQALQFTNGRGFQTAALQYTELRLGEGYAGVVAQQREHVFIPDMNQDQGKIQEAPLFSAEKFTSYYGVPLIAKGKLVGVLEIFNRTPLDPNIEWVNYLKLLAGQIAIAIDNSNLFNDLQRTNVDLTLAYDATIEGWARALELKDMETEGHSRRVVKMTMDLARKMGISGDKFAHVRRGAMLHDIGKMGIPDSILQKPGKLSDEEWQIMRQHPVYAREWLSPIQYLQPALDIPYSHHERWDGTGYPRGLAGEQIPLEARIFAIVDVWDALNSDRPYRKAWSKEKTLIHIREQSGKHFDPKVVEIFIDYIGNHPLK